LTRLTLIGALCRGLRWEEFLGLYGPAILFWGRRDFGLQGPDAENLRQEVLLRVWRGIGGYEPAKGRFRNWLYTCTRNAARNLWRDRHREWVGSDRPEVRDQLLNRAAPAPAPWAHRVEECSPEEALQVWEEEGFAEEGLQDAVMQVRARVQPATWRAFLLFEFLGMSAKEIGPRLGMKPLAVNQAVYRVRQLLQQTCAAGRPARTGPGESKR
jgi:RNA polymerase sigma-70 factor (ECF subfamily)